MVAYLSKLHFSHPRLGLKCQTPVKVVYVSNFSLLVHPLLVVVLVLVVTGVKQSQLLF